MKTLTYFFDKLFTSQKADRVSQLIVAVIAIYFIAQISIAIIKRS